MNEFMDQYRNYIQHNQVNCTQAGSRIDPFLDINGNHKLSTNITYEWLIITISLQVLQRNQLYSSQNKFKRDKILEITK